MNRVVKTVVVTVCCAVTLFVVAVSAFVFIGTLASKLTLPRASEVSSVVWRQRGDDPRTESELKLTDSDRISKLLHLLESQNFGWKKPMFAPAPMGQHRLVFRGREDQSLLVLWIGKTVIAGRNGNEDSGGNRSRGVPEEFCQEMVAVLQEAATL